ncbi:MAG TPA: glycosyltransferase family 1 protein [Chitinophagales bacterium]|nr:glycosyltransferase family 1 protein [Chitinophagales bacterium]
MKIAVNTRFLIKNKLEGIGWFTYESLKRITAQHPEHQFYFFFDRKFDEEFIFSSNITPIVLNPQARHALLWYWWFEVSIPEALKKIQPDLFLSTDGYCSLHAHCKQVLVIHDLAFEHYHDQIDWLSLKYYRYFTPRYARKATRIATVSEFTKEDVMKQYQIPAAKIDVAWNGSNELFHPLTEEEKQKVKRDFTSGSDYFVYAGALQPRKNIINLFLAFDEFKKKTSAEIKLVIAGRNWQYREAMKVYTSLQHKRDVIFPGHLSRIDLSRLMGGALALVYVSFFEGFGIPIVEAMNCDVPVITSNVSSMPEVAGDAALFVDPHSVSDIASKLELIFLAGTGRNNESLRNQLIEKGRVQRQKFTWQNTADRLWECVMKAIEQ